ncbi:hydroxyacylglutathione hydrolase [Imbroritus primus]|uniref:Hydroxyacylglutathione hydrolase n=1 Tax=Imbroritus primus TaxID=3058603 RepID=A0ACD3SQP8_9BURK|nr:hydroxyacylglutathione hydrolase [Burkholderiaceae bacterium PBA]
MQIVPIQAFDDNYIWAVHDGHAAAIVDPGDAGPVLRFLKDNALLLGAIVITHHHRDHVGGIGELLDYAPRVRGLDGVLPVIGPATEEIPHRTRAVEEGETVELAMPALTLRVLEVPGHTRGHVAYVGDVDGPVLFCGDTLFASGCGRLFEGTPEQMLASLDKLAALPAQTRVYCAHEYTRSNVAFARHVEPESVAIAQWQEEVARLRQAGQPTVPTTLAHEKRVNPFLRSREDSVRRNVMMHERMTSDAGISDAAMFGALRRWKDGF